MDANYQVKGINQIWSKIVTAVLVTATFVVFFIIIWPFAFNYLRYYRGGLSNASESLSVVKLPDVANESTIKSGTNQTDQNLSKQITFYIKTSNLEISAPIVEGVSQEDLYRGIGHHPGTPWPSDLRGNVILTGHSSWLDPANRYGFVFKNLSRLKIGDEIQIKYPEKDYKYEVKEKYWINPDDTTLFSQKVNKPTLTVYTCSPAYTNWKRLVYVAQIK